MLCCLCRAPRTDGVGILSNNRRRYLEMLDADTFTPDKFYSAWTAAHCMDLTGIGSSGRYKYLGYLACLPELEYSRIIRLTQKLEGGEDVADPDLDFIKGTVAKQEGAGRAGVSVKGVRMHPSSLHVEHVASHLACLCHALPVSPPTYFPCCDACLSQLGTHAYWMSCVAVLHADPPNNHLQHFLDAIFTKRLKNAVVGEKGTISAAHMVKILSQSGETYGKLVTWQYQMFKARQQHSLTKQDFEAALGFDVSGCALSSLAAPDRSRPCLPLHSQFSLLFSLDDSMPICYCFQVEDLYHPRVYPAVSDLYSMIHGDGYIFSAKVKGANRTNEDTKISPEPQDLLSLGAFFLQRDPSRQDWPVLGKSLPQIKEMIGSYQ